MAADREWLTEGEVKSVVHAEMRDALRAQTVILEKQNLVLDKIADGAQAQILSANILHGNVELGLKGFVPDVLDRLKAVEEGQIRDRDLVNERHGETSGRLARLESNQHRIRRLTLKAYAWSVKSADGGVDYGRVTALVTVIFTCLHFLFRHIPTWFQVKRFAFAVVHAAGI